ncbi:hypothetical protein WMY93_003312 [Mugilogobius chulae]|uniref:Fibronectin type-III domain-containing protein n=1 Tax=Mugilogobius chulae TaxID=88201 RepID=A0AAW0PW79_9GOBI
MVTYPWFDSQLNKSCSCSFLPQSVISSVNETSVMLEWMAPRDSGGREDVVFNIICKSCGGGRGGCTRCGDNVQFVPRQLGLTESRVYISDLLAHTQYTLKSRLSTGCQIRAPTPPICLSQHHHEPGR